MKTSDRIKTYVDDLTPEAKMCVNCVHFTRHYVQMLSNKFIPIADGHCAYPRLKSRRVFDTCNHFINKHGSGT